MRATAVQKFVSVLLLSLALWSAPSQAQEAAARYTLRVDGLACPFCAYGIEKQLMAVDGVNVVEIDIAAGAVRIIMRPGATLDEAAAAKAVTAAGFTMRAFQREGKGP